MPALIPLVVIVPLIAFWVWMFGDMLRNPHIPSSHPEVLRWPPIAKNHWIVFFVILNIFTAGYYYLTVCREQ